MYLNFFFNEIKTQFNVAIETLRSDSAREYRHSAPSEFCRKQGIIHQTSCSYSPQQNGVEKHKNRHLLEIARTLLFHMNVPSKFWTDAILTACYL